MYQLLLITFLLAVGVPSSYATLVSMKASGAIVLNGTDDNTIPVGTVWSFELVYDTDAPDLDLDSGSGVYDAMAAVRSFHYTAGSYQIALDDPAAFLAGSNMLINSGAIDSLDINLNSSAIPQIGGKNVHFHADFNNFVNQNIFPTDALPSNTALGLNDFQNSSVTLGVEGAGGGAILGSSEQMTSLSFSIVPEVSTGALVGLGMAALVLARGWGRRTSLKRMVEGY